MITDYTQRITESPEELLMLSKDLRGKTTYPRVRMLWLLKTGTVKHVTDCVPLLGFSWIQLERWWLLYKKGGLSLLLKEKPAGGRPSLVTEEALAALQTEMKKGTIATQREVRLYLKEHWGIVYRSDSTICRLFQRLRIRKKTGRKQHPKGDERAQQAFKDEFAKRLQAQEVKHVFALDESRFGLMTWFRRRWCPLGFRPPWVGQIKREWFWLYGAVEPTTGESFFLFLPTLDQACFELFLAGLQQKVSAETTAVVMDQAAAHGGQGLTWPEGLIPMPLPPYSPELNPMERVFEHLRERLANQVFDSLEDLQASLTAELKKFWENPKVLVSLTNFPWWKKALAEPPTLSFPEKAVQFFKELFRSWQAALQKA